MPVRVFYGEFRVEPALRPEHWAYLRQFSRSRRMRRDPVRTADLSDPLRIAVGLPIGIDAGYYVGMDEYGGDLREPSIVDVNVPPGQPSMREYLGDEPLDEDERLRRLRAYWDAQHKAWLSGEAQPDLWCQWIPTDDGRAIVWDRGEKFERPDAWIEYLLRHFLVPWGYVLNGRVEWDGPDEDEYGVILVTDNELR